MTFLHFTQVHLVSGVGLFIEHILPKPVLNSVALMHFRMRSAP